MHSTQFFTHNSYATIGDTKTIFQYGSTPEKVSLLETNFSGIVNCGRLKTEFNHRCTKVGSTHSKKQEYISKFISKKVFPKFSRKILEPCQFFQEKYFPEGNEDLSSAFDLIFQAELICNHQRLKKAIPVFHSFRSGSYICMYILSVNNHNFRMSMHLKKSDRSKNLETN